MDPPLQQPGITLPVDIILLIIESLVPKNTQPILPASDPVTKTLVAFTRVCKATYPVASRLLWNFCLYIDSPDRATQFLRFLSSAPVLPRARPWQAYDSASLFLAPYKEEDEEDDYYEYDYSDESSFVDRPGPLGVPAISSPPSPPPPPPAPNNLPTTQVAQDDHVSAAPTTSAGSPPSSPLGDPVPVMNATDDSESDDPSSSASYTTMPSSLDLPTTYAVQDILTTLAPILKRLVIDMPLRSIRPEWDHMGIKPHLRRAFEALVNIEEFVSIRDELYLATIDEIPHTEPEVWAECWPKLRRIALYNPYLEGDYWHSMAQPPDLELFVGTRPDPPAAFFHEFDITEKWHSVARQTRTPQEFTLTIVDCVPEIEEFVAVTTRWERPDPPNSVHVRAVGVIPPTEKDDYDEKHDNVWAWTGDPIAATQHWVKKQALKGTLWDEAWRGYEVTGTQNPTS